MHHIPGRGARGVGGGSGEAWEGGDTHSLGVGTNCRVPIETGKPGKKSGHGKVMEHGKLTKSHEIL